MGRWLDIQKGEIPEIPVGEPEIRGRWLRLKLGKEPIERIEEAMPPVIRPAYRAIREPLKERVEVTIPKADKLREEFGEPSPIPGLSIPMLVKLSTPRKGETWGDIAKQWGEAFKTIPGWKPGRFFYEVKERAREWVRGGLEIPISFAYDFFGSITELVEGKRAGELTKDMTLKVPKIGELRSLEKQWQDSVKAAKGNLGLAATFFGIENLTKAIAFYYGVKTVAQIGVAILREKPVSDMVQRLEDFALARREELPYGERIRLRKIMEKMMKPPTPPPAKGVPGVPREPILPRELFPGIEDMRIPAIVKDLPVKRQISEAARLVEEALRTGKIAVDESTKIMASEIIRAIPLEAIAWTDIIHPIAAQITMEMVKQLIPFPVAKVPFKVIRPLIEAISEAPVKPPVKVPTKVEKPEKILIPTEEKVPPKVPTEEVVAPEEVKPAEKILVPEVAKPEKILVPEVEKPKVKEVAIEPVKELTLEEARTELARLEVAKEVATPEELVDIEKRIRTVESRVKELAPEQARIVELEERLTEIEAKKEAGIELTSAERKEVIDIRKEIAELKKKVPVKPKKVPVKKIPKELEPLAKEARKYKSVEEFVSSTIFERSLAGEETKALAIFKGKTVADKLTNFYTQAIKEVKPEVLPPVEKPVPKKPRLTIEQMKWEIERVRYVSIEELRKIKPEEIKKTYEKAVREKKITPPVSAEIEKFEMAREVVKRVKEKVSPAERRISEKEVKKAITKEKIELKKEKEILTTEGTVEKTPQMKANQKIEELFAGIPLYKIAEIPTIVKGTKLKLLDRLGSELVRYYGLSDEARRAFTKLLKGNDLRKEDIVKFISHAFPLGEYQSPDSLLLSHHQEHPAKYPIPDELKTMAAKVELILRITKGMTKERKLLKEFFPQSFIRRTNKEILEHQEVLSVLKRPEAITRHQNKIKELEEYKKFLGELRYVPHIYLPKDTIERHFMSLLPEGRITSKFRSALSKLKGRKIDTLDKAKKLGLLPEEDIRVILATHLEYVFRKSAIYDTIEMLKKNTSVVLPDAEAPFDWRPVAISQLSGYKVHPFMVKGIEDFSVSRDINLVMQGYDAVNHLGKSMVFYNFLILPFWDMFQAYAAGTITPWRPKYSLSLIRQGFNDVLNETELYREAVEGGLISTPKAGHYAPSINEMIKLVINRMNKQYPGWKKLIERATGEKVSLKTATIVPSLYKANWKLTWFLDRGIRLATLHHCLNAGMDLPDAIDTTNDFHANYDIFTQKAKLLLNRGFLTPTYKANMLLNLPAKIMKYSGSLAGKAIRWKWKEITPREKIYFGALWRIIGLWVGIIGVAAYFGYRLREGYRLVKRLKEPEVTKEGRILEERVITLPGPFFEWFKVIRRVKEQKLSAIYMYLAKLPQVVWSGVRNRSWRGEKYYDEGASPDIQRRQFILSILRDYVAPVDRADLMTKEEVDALDNILSIFGAATYKRGSTESSILWRQREDWDKVRKYIISPERTTIEIDKAIKAYTDRTNKRLKELEDYIKQMYK